MNILFATINGSEDLAKVDDPRLVALIKFYQAFNQGDLMLMQKVWLNTDEASMDNPVGGIMRGWDTIKSVYERIFFSDAKVYVEFYDYTIHSTNDMFLVTGRERGFFEKGNMKVDLSIRTSRVFIRQNDEWKQLQHHGSIDQPELLRKYQNAVV
ncbi:YybH family protein [Anaerophaga thermohalophila]|uniref:YybH family protein n=1 Tax=Anaerophaga thermohalophila TaxID=177400 RepID=UPI000306531E|nr:nuclear transport factor 2 family protein [Anaerophaga thermohalophila]